MNIPIAVLKLSKICEPDNYSQRFVLSAIKVESCDGETNFVATDGRRLCAVRLFGEVDPALDGKLIPGAMLREALAYIEAVKPKRAPEMTLAAEGGVDAVLTVGDANFRGKFVDGKFPKWRELFDTCGSGKSLLLDSEYLASLSHVVGSADELTDHPNPLVILTLPENRENRDAPIKVSSRKGDVQAVGLLMPVTGEFEAATIEKKVTVSV